MLLAVGGAPSAGGQVPPVASESPSAEALERGRAVALGAGGAAEPHAACVTCHGMDGVGDASGAFPRLTGQAGWYLYKQLKDYATGTRPNDVMSPIAGALDDRQMADVAAYYAEQEARSAEMPQADPLTLQEGGVISAMGIPDKGVAACVNCHGPAGRGLPPSFPYLAGQYPAYVELQLRLWRDGVRRNDPLGVMAVIARALSDEEMRAVSLYFASVRLEEAQRRPGDR